MEDSLEASNAELICLQRDSLAIKQESDRKLNELLSNHRGTDFDFLT